MNERDRLYAQADALDEVARWALQPDLPTGIPGAVTVEDLQLRAVALRTRADFTPAPASGCGGCEGMGAHRRHCPRNPNYTHWLPMQAAAEDLGDRVGSNNTGLANTFYAAASELRTMHIEALARKIRRSSEHGLDRGPEPDASGEAR
jgi:hypothetical protein